LLTTRRHTPKSTLFPYTTLFRSEKEKAETDAGGNASGRRRQCGARGPESRARARTCRARFRSGRGMSSPDRTTKLSRVALRGTRSEEHTSELQSLRHLVCRLLLE